MNKNQKVSNDKAIFYKSMKQAIKEYKPVKISKREMRIKQLKLQISICKFLKSNFVSMRKDIVKAVNCSRTTVYDNLFSNTKSLFHLGLVNRIIVKLNKAKGRPITLWFLTENEKEVKHMFKKIDFGGKNDK